MGEDTPSSESAMQTLGQPATGAPESGATPETSKTPASIDDALKEIADLTAKLKQARADSVKNHSKAKELDELKSQIETEKLSVTERLQKQYDDLKAQHEEYTQAQTERDIKHIVALEAAKLGVDPNILGRVAQFLDWEEIDVDESGNPTNIRELVEQLVKDIPGLIPQERRSKGAPVSSGGATNPPRSQTDGNTGEITASYVADVMSGKISWQSLTPERRTAILNWQAKNPFRF